MYYMAYIVDVFASLARAAKTRGTMICGLHFFVWLLVVQDSGCSPQPNSTAAVRERNLLHYLFHSGRHDKNVRPVTRVADPVNVTFGLAVHEIEDLDDKMQILIIRATIKESWVDKNLKWNPEEFASVKYISVHPKTIWIPDIVLYDNAGEGFGAGVRRTMAVVRYDGLVTMNMPSIIRSSCKISVTDYPFDSQRCILKFGSWTYHGSYVALNIEQPRADLSDYSESAEWWLKDVPGEFHSVMYLCCPHPYHDITYTVDMKRRSLYYSMYLIIPCSMVAALTLLLFFLPPDCNERMTVGMALLIALSFFFLMVADNMPATSQSVPLIGVYYTVTMMLVCSVFFMTCWVLRFHYSNPLDGEVPNWIRVILLKCAAWIFCFEFGSSQSLGTESPAEGMEQAKLTLSGTEASKDVVLRNANSILAHNLHQQAILEARRQQWKRAALVLNHVFMWLFLGLCTLSYAFIFLRAPII